MPPTRRSLLLAAPALAAAAPSRPGRAQQRPPAGAAAGAAPPPVLFLHGNGDHAALWLTTLWRFESNGWPGDRLWAVSFPDPLARDDDAAPQAMRSGSAEQTAHLAGFVREFRARTGADRVALVANSRGGYPIRDFVVHGGGAAEVSHAVLCGTPNRGVLDWPERRGSEFNATGPFLRRLNGGEADVAPGTAFLTLRSDAGDLYAQPRAVWNAAAPDRPTGTDTDGPALRGATNLVLPGLDHREVAYHPRAFAEVFAFVAGGRAPDRLAVPPEERPVLDGLVTGAPGGVPTNRPVGGAAVEVFRVDPETGARLGEGPLHRRTTGADGRWGPVAVAPDWPLEFVLAAPDHPAVTHVYRSPFPRSSAVVHLRPARPPSEEDRAAGGGALLFARPRGYFGVPRDVVLLDGRTPPEVPRGVPRAALATLRLPPAELGRPVPCLFNEERIVARAWPAAEGRVAVAELTW